MFQALAEEFTVSPADARIAAVSFSTDAEV